MSNSNIDFSSILEESGKHSSSERQKQRFKKHMWVAVTAGVIALSFAAYLIFAFVSKTDFSSNIPLSENISRWTPLNWESDGVSDEAGGVAFTANGADWEPVAEGQYFVAEYKESTCTLKFTRLGNGLGTTDKNSTDKYTEEFRKLSPEQFSSSNVWLKTTNSGTEIEFVKASYVNEEGNPSYSYYRASPENNGFVLLIASCDSAAMLEELLPDEGGAEVEEIATVKPSAFSPF